MPVEVRRVAAAWRSDETIAEPELEDSPSGLVGINIHAPAMRDEQGAQVIDAMNVVRVFVRIEHAVEVIDVGTEQLLAQIRRGVHQHPGLPTAWAGAIDQNRAASPPILGIAGVAGPPPCSG